MAKMTGNIVLNFKRWGLKSLLKLLYLYIIISIIILASGVLYYMVQKHRLTIEKSAGLSDIAELKVEQITDFRNERLSEAKFFYGNQTFIETVKNLIDNSDSKSWKSLNDWTEPILNNHAYDAIILFDAKTKKRIFVTGKNKIGLNNGDTSDITECLNTGKIIEGDIEMNHAGNNAIHLDIFIPLIRKTDFSTEKIAVAVIIQSPSEKLYGLIQSFPNSSATGEILIVKKENDKVLYLNELRFKKNTALKFSLPINTKDLPSARVLKGEKRVFAGIDYRGKKVLAVGKSIPGTSWTLIAQIDTSEIYQGLKRRAILILVTVFILIIITGLVLRWWWDRRNMDILKSKIDNLNTIYRLSRVYKLLSSVEQAIVKSNEKDKLLSDICRIIYNEGGYSICWIGVENAGTGCIEPFTHCGIEEPHPGSFKFPLSGIWDTDIKAGINFVSNDIWNDPRMEKVRENAIPIELKSIAVIPIIQKSKLTGTINLFSDKTNFFMEDEINLLQLLSSDISFALDKIRNEEKLKENEQKLIEQNRELIKINEKYINVNEGLRESNERIKKANKELIIAREKAEESGRLKSAFVANMSHEIRTPLTSIIGFAGLMKNSELTMKEQDLYSSVIINKSNELLKIISDILDISKIESNTVTLHFESFFFGKFIDDLNIEYTKKLDLENKNNIRLISVSAMDQFQVSTDFVKYKQIFTNLLDNAIKFTESGQISFGYHHHDSNQLCCFVSDSGIGIDPQYKDLIFEMFRQVENKKKLNYGGTGLGLAICKGYSNLLGGDIWVESEPGRGSVFYFTINYNQKVQNVNKDKKLIHNDLQLKDKTILIIEDDPYSIEYLKRILQINGNRIFIAQSGNETQEYYNKLAEIDIILLDMRLPDANGIDLVKQIKSLRKDIPVIAQTAFTLEDDRNKCLEAGCDEYISKPYKKEELLNLILTFLKQ